MPSDTDRLQQQHFFPQVLKLLCRWVVQQGEAVCVKGKTQAASAPPIAESACFGDNPVLLSKAAEQGTAATSYPAHFLHKSTGRVCFKPSLLLVGASKPHTITLPAASAPTYPTPAPTHQTICADPSRHRMPDMELVMSVRDNALANKTLFPTPVPVFSWSLTEQHWDLPWWVGRWVETNTLSTV